MTIQVVFPTKHHLHVPDGEIWVGFRVAGTELPERGEVVAEALVRARYVLQPSGPIDDAALHAAPFDRCPQIDPVLYDVGGGQLAACLLVGG